MFACNEFGLTSICLINRAAPMPPTPIPLRGGALYNRAKSGKHNFGPISPYLAICTFIWPRDPFILSFQYEISGIPRISAQTTVRNAFSHPPFLYSSNIILEQCIFGKRDANLPNDFARNFRDPSRVVASALLCRHSFLGILVNCS